MHDVVSFVSRRVILVRSFSFVFLFFRFVSFRFFSVCCVLFVRVRCCIRDDKYSNDPV